MTAMANIVVQSVAGGNVTYVAMNPASGDGVRALWRQSALSPQPAAQPWANVWSHNNGKGNARRVNFEFRYPESYTTTTTGLVSIANQYVFTGSVLIPSGAPQTLAAEGAKQGTYFLASPLMLSVLTDGFAPT